MASTAVFSSHRAQVGYSIPVKNTFINFDIYGLASPSSPSSRVRCKSCPYSTSYHLWEDAAQELCHAMTPPSRPRRAEQAVVSAPRVEAAPPAAAKRPQQAPQQQQAPPPAKGKGKAQPQSQLPAKAASAPSIKVEPKQTQQPQPQPQQPQQPQQSALRAATPAKGDDDAISTASSDGNTAATSSDGANKLSAWTDVASRKRTPKAPKQQEQPDASPATPATASSPSAAVALPRPPTAGSSAAVATPKARAAPARQEPASPAGGKGQPLALPRTTSAGGGGKGDGKGKGGLQHFTKIDVGIKDEPHFRVVQKLIGPSGKHMKEIIAEAQGAKIWMIGKGSRSWEDDIGPLVICVGTQSIKSFENAIRLVNELLVRVREEHEQFTIKAKSWSAPSSGVR